MTQIAYEKVVIQESNDPLIDASTYPFVIAPAYYEQGISMDPVIRLRKGVLDRLVKAQETFNGQYQFKLWDGHRPRSVQGALYDAFYAELATRLPDASPDEIAHETQRYVTKATDSSRIPPHATGGAIDLTLVDSNGDEVGMGTDFDYFGPEAETNYYDNSPEHKLFAQNRKILFDALIKQGFTNDTEEWWHYDYGNQVWAYHTGTQVAHYGEV